MTGGCQQPLRADDQATGARQEILELFFGRAMIAQNSFEHLAGALGVVGRIAVMPRESDWRQLGPSRDSPANPLPARIGELVHIGAFSRDANRPLPVAALPSDPSHVAP